MFFEHFHDICTVITQRQHYYLNSYLYSGYGQIFSRLYCGTHVVLGRSLMSSSSVFKQRELCGSKCIGRRKHPVVNQDIAVGSLGYISSLGILQQFEECLFQPENIFAILTNEKRYNIEIFLKRILLDEKYRNQQRFNRLKIIIVIYIQGVPRDFSNRPQDGR